MQKMKIKIQRGNVESIEMNFNIQIEKNKNKKVYLQYYALNSKCLLFKRNCKYPFQCHLISYGSIF